MKHNSTTHLYAQWSEATVTPGQAYTITYMDGDVKVGEEIVAAGESTAIMDGRSKKILSSRAGQSNRTGQPFTCPLIL